MSTERLQALQSSVRVRHGLSLSALALPLLIAFSVVALRWLSLASVMLIVASALLLVGVFIVRALRAVDKASIVRALNATVPSLDDSVELLLRHRSELSALQSLQRERVAAQLDRAQIPDLRPAWPWKKILASCAASILVIALSWMPSSISQTKQSPAPVTSIAADDVVAFIEVQSSVLRIEAPAYTGVSSREENVLEAKFPAGSQLNWSLTLTGEAHAVALEFHDGSQLALLREGDHWTGKRQFDESTLYRIVIDGKDSLADDRLYRLDAIADLAPDIRVIAPDRTLTVLEDEQFFWNLAFQVSDDYAVAAAQLHVTVAQGSGEQVTIKEQNIRLRAESGNDARLQHYRHRLDLRALEFAQGDDVIVRLLVTDKREPRANSTRSASYILRWPAELSAEAEGIDGIVQKVLPAYFRSQRQIIIDSEALLAEKAKLSKEKFLARSDAIGVDQKILRLRYGQFLGEEFESGRTAKPNDDAKAEKDSDDDAHALPEGHSADDGHDHTPAAFGDANAAIAEFGHTHDHAEAATLLDPETKRILKAALEEMWQAEMHLRLGDPAMALPYENRALTYIKQVQQSTRIYLARVGLELPPVDETRRLSGERTGVSDRRGFLTATAPEAIAVSDAWNALENGTDVDLDALLAWIDGNTKALDDPLALVAAIDAWRRDKQCASCANHLQNLLWPLLPKQVPGAQLRRAPNAAGDAYLKALSEGVVQ